MIARTRDSRFLQTLFGGPTLGNIVDLADGIHGMAAVVPDRGHTGHPPAHVAVLAQIALLHVIGIDFTVEKPRPLPLMLPPIIGDG